MSPKAWRTVRVVVLTGVGIGGYLVWQRGLRDEALTDAVFRLGISEIPYASTRGHMFDGKLFAGHSKYEYETVGAVPGLAKGAPAARDILIVLHGLNNGENKAINRFCLARESLRRNRYGGVVIGFNWDGATNWDPYEATGYKTAKHNAIANGPKLAQFIVDLAKANRQAKVRVIGYSMGARLAVEAIKSLDEDSRFAGWKGKVESLHLVGAAVDNEQLQTDDLYGKAIEHRVRYCYNYYSPKDRPLGKFYRVLEGDRAVGRSDIEDPSKAPANYYSRDATNELKDFDANGGADEKAPRGKNHSSCLGIRNDQGVWEDDGEMNLVAEDIRNPGRRDDLRPVVSDD